MPCEMSFLNKKRASAAIGAGVFFYGCGNTFFCQGEMKTGKASKIWDNARGKQGKLRIMKSFTH